MKTKLIFAGMLALVGSVQLSAQNTSYIANTTPIGGTNSTGFGTGALGANTGNANTANGWKSLFSNTTGPANTATGYLSLYSNIGGTHNVANGVNALIYNKSGNYNVAMGSNALYSNSTGNGMVGIGEAALNANTADYNVGVGYNALTANTSGGANVAVGAYALQANTTGGGNVALGMQALYSNVVGMENTAVGHQALLTSTGNYNSAFGYFSLVNTTTGIANTAIGAQAFQNNTTGSNGTAVGFGSLVSNTTGKENTAVGSGALNAVTTTDYHTAIGFHALFNTGGTAYDNTAVGHLAMYYNVNGSDNTALGKEALYSNTAGGNTAVGKAAFTSNTTGYDNTALGTICDVSSPGFHNASAIGYATLSDASDRVWLGNANVVNGNVWSYGTYHTISDGRFKTNINENDVKGLEFIKLLRPVVYNVDAKKATEFKCKNMSDEAKKKYLGDDFTAATAIRQSGFIAQEVEVAAKQVGYNFNGLTIPKNDNETYGIAYAQFVVPLVKAVQEQQAIIDLQKADNLKQIQDLQQQIETLKTQMNDNQQKTGSATGINTNNLSASGFSMDQNEPNPFSTETTINFTLPQTTGNAALYIYDLTGKQITSYPINDRGTSSIKITSEKLAPGIYIYSVVADNKVVDSKRMIVADK